MAVAFHAETGQLDLRPDSPAYAKQLRLISSRIVAAASDAVGTQAVRTVRVLAVGARLFHEGVADVQSFATTHET